MPHRFLNGGLPRIAQNTGDRFDGHAPIILVALLEMTPFVCELAGKGAHDFDGAARFERGLVAAKSSLVRSPRH
ncbi:hypothetical protein, partial [Salmonella enterica]|uniref:hypothetical protein n=1 Tax=Salmonella enterica TaxID=28901 RepID=UPI0020C2696B